MGQLVPGGGIMASRWRRSGWLGRIIILTTVAARAIDAMLFLAPISISSPVQGPILSFSIWRGRPVLLQKKDLLIGSGRT